MQQKFPSRIAGCAQRSDHRRFFYNRIVCRNCKNERHDGNQDVQQYLHHRLVTAHIVAGKFDCLVAVARQITRQRGMSRQNLDEIIGPFFFLVFIFRFRIVFPGIAVFDMVIGNGIIPFFGHDSHTEFNRIEHHVTRIAEQRTVIRKCHKTGNRQFFFINRDHITDLQVIIVRIHTVNCNFILLLRHFAFHQADQIELCSGFKKTDRALWFRIQIRVGIFVFIEILVNRYLLFFQPCSLVVGELLFCCKISVFHVVFFKAFIVSIQHALIRNEKTGHKANRRRHKQKNNEIFSNIVLQFPQQAFS